LICDTPYAGFDLVMVNSWYENITESFDQVICLINTQEKNTLLQSVWEPKHEKLKTMGEGDYRATVLQSDQPADDGGKRLEYTEDRGLFNSILLEFDDIRSLEGA